MVFEQLYNNYAREASLVDDAMFLKESLHGVKRKPGGWAPPMRGFFDGPEPYRLSGIINYYSVSHKCPNPEIIPMWKVLWNGFQAKSFTLAE